MLYEDLTQLQFTEKLHAMICEFSAGVHKLSEGSGIQERHLEHLVEFVHATQQDFFYESGPELFEKTCEVLHLSIGHMTPFCSRVFQMETKDIFSPTYRVRVHLS